MKSEEEAAELVDGGKQQCSPEQTAMLHRMRCKSALTICVVIYFSSVLYFSRFGINHFDSDSDPSALYISPYSNQNPSRIKRTLTTRKFGVPRWSKKYNSREFVDNSSYAFVTRKILQANNEEIITCKSGHIQGLSAICESTGCLRKLTKDEKRHVASKKNEFSLEIKKKIGLMGGNLDPVHYSLVSMVTEMQWEDGVYGSLGEIGVYEGKFTSVLTLNMDISSGERIFVSDDFSDYSESVSGLQLSSIFLMHMEELGFFTNSDKEETNLYLHTGNSYELDKHLFRGWNLPQFRLISIGADLEAIKILISLEKACCLLRDGGVVVVDGVDTVGSNARAALIEFFHKHGSSALTPFLAAKNKLYLCTTNRKRRYSEFLLTKKDVMLTFELREVTNDNYGETFTYFNFYR